MMSSSSLSSTNSNELEINEKRTSLLNEFVSNNDLFGCLLISQLETVDAVSQLDKQFSSIVSKTILIENLVNITMNKYNAMEESMRGFMQQFENLNLNLSSSWLSSSPQLYNNQKENQQQLLLLNEAPASPLESLVEVCSDLLEKENYDYSASVGDTSFCQLIEEKSSAAPSSFLLMKSEQIKDEDEKSSVPPPVVDLVCVEHATCFYCKAHSKYLLLSDQKPPESPASLIFNNNENLTQVGGGGAAAAANVGEVEDKYSKECQEYKEIQRQFNKRVKYEVNKKFGSYYLADHQVRELDVKEMYHIRKKVMRLFKPFPLPIKLAWNNAMNSLRQDRHQLNKWKRIK